MSEICVVVRLNRKVTPEGMENFKAYISGEEKRIGCKVLLLPEHCEVVSAGNAACGYQQTFGGNSVSLFCQNRKDLELMLTYLDKQQVPS